jgi:nucleolar protein 15
LEGFESDSSSDSEVGAPLALPPVPKKTNREKKLAKKAAKAAAASVPVPSVPGTIYLGHIPHGFFEKQMHSYFSQFGTITRLRLSRNRRTGKSKHYGWVEFQSKDVAEIVAETMDGYLIHPHRMVCKVVEVDDNVWKGANKVFKKIPWVRINREKLEGKRTKEKWEDLAKKDEERMEKRMQKIKDLGIEYEFPTKGEKRKAEDQVPEVKSKKGKVEKGTKAKRIPSGATKTKAQK